MAALLAWLTVIGGCGSHSTRGAADLGLAAGAAAGLKLRHQIMARYGDEAQVFEGYMILAGDALIVRAFAGPGIDLFTVVRRGIEHEEKAHVPGLSSRLDLAAVGADIARAYFPGCGTAAAGSAPATVECRFFGEPLLERGDGRGRVVERRFPEAHGTGLRVRYSEYREFAGGELAGRITLEWGAGENSLVILLLEAEVIEIVDPALFRL